MSPFVADPDEHELSDNIALSPVRRELALMGYMHLDLDHIFLQQLTPTAAMDVLDDLVKERLLTRSKTSQLQERILALVGVDGHWKPENMA